MREACWWLCAVRFNRAERKLLSLRSFVDAKADLAESDVTQVATVGFAIITSREAAADFFAQVCG